MILHQYVPGEGRPIHKQRVASHLAVVPHMQIRKEEILRANPRDSTGLFRPAADCYIFSKDIFFANFQFHMLAGKRIVLGIAANYAKTMKYIARSELGRTMHGRVRMQYASFLQFNSCPHHGICTHLHTRSQFRFRRNYRSRVYLLLHFAHSAGMAASTRSTMTHIMLASVHNFPSTKAFPSILQRSPFHDAMSTSTRIWSPGTMGRRNFTLFIDARYISFFSRSG